MNKKTILSIILACIMLSSFIMPCYAEDADAIAEIESIANDENAYIIDEASDGREGESLIEGIDTSTARKVYFSETTLLTAYEGEPTVDSIITDKYQWWVLSGENGDTVSVFNESQEGIRWSGMRPAQGCYLPDNEIEKIISNSGIASSEIVSIKHIFAAMYYVVFTVIETDSEIYCIPYSTNDEYLGLTNKTLYVFDDMMQTLIKRFDESKLLENPDSYGGVPLRQEEKP